MNTLPLSRLTGALLLATASLACAPLQAASKVAQPGALATYKQERAECMTRPQEERANCLREAGAAYADRTPNSADADPGSHARNQIKRCEALSGADRSDCVSRMQGRGTTSGSVAGGGIYRELVTREVVMPMPAGAAAPGATK